MTFYATSYDIGWAGRRVIVAWMWRQPFRPFRRYAWGLDRRPLGTILCLGWLVIIWPRVGVTP